MTKEKNISVISAALSAGKTSLEQKMKDKEALIKAEAASLIATEEKKLLEAISDPEKLSPAHAKQKFQQQKKMITGSTLMGGLVGAGAFAVTMMTPSISTAIGGLLAGTFLASVPVIVAVAVTGILAAASITAAGYGVGVAKAKLMPFTPTLLTEQQVEIQNKAKEKIETEMISNQLCQLRLERTTGKLNHLEFAEVCEAMYDLAILQHKIPESIAQKLKDSAQEARAIHKEESHEKREEEKLELEKKKEAKQEEREDIKEKMSLRKLRQDMELERLLTAAKIQRSGNESNPLQDIMQLAMQAFGGARAAA